MLALALAESAQQASAHSQKRPGDAHAESTNYGEAEAGTALEKLHLSAGAPDKLHLYTGLPESRLHFQTGAPVEQDFQGSSSTPGEQNHPPGAPGSQDPLPPLHTPGDVPGSRDAEQEQSSFHPGKPGDQDHFPSHAGDWEHTPLHPPGALPDWEPPAADLPVDKSQLRTCGAGDKHHIPICTADDKLQSPPVLSAGEKTTPASLPYLAPIQTAAAEPQRAPVGATTTQAEVAVPAPRTAPSSQPALAQRHDPQAATGQVPVASAKAPSASSQVCACATPSLSWACNHRRLSSGRVPFQMAQGRGVTGYWEFHQSQA